MDQYLTGTLGLVIVIFITVWFILWIFLPFAIFGTKDRLDKLIAQNEKIIALMQSNNARVSDKDVPSVTIHNHDKESMVYNSDTGKMEST